MPSQDQRMIQKQAELISRLNEEIRTMQRQYAEAKKQAAIYRAMQDAIKKDPIILQNWMDFVTMWKLKRPEDEKIFEASPVAASPYDISNFY
jgi:hypothetical protein